MDVAMACALVPTVDTTFGRLLRYANFVAIGVTLGCTAQSIYCHITVTTGSGVDPLHVAATVGLLYAMANMYMISLSLLFSVVRDHNRRFAAAAQLSRFVSSTPCGAVYGSSMTWQTPVLNVAAPCNMPAVSRSRRRDSDRCVS